MMRPDSFIAVRANGGHLIHVLPPTGNAALCGHQPANKPSRSMSPRGKWLYYGDGARLADGVSCLKCKAAYQSTQGEVK